MSADKTFVFIHPDTGLETTERREECARLLHILHSQKGRWMEAFDLVMALGSVEVAARMSNVKKTHGPNLILKRHGRKTAKGKRLMEYRINPEVRVIGEKG